MKAVITRDFSIAPEGHTVYHYKTGDKVSGKVAEVAVANQAALEIADIETLETKISPPQETKAKRHKSRSNPIKDKD